jgi:hypothetical protein
MVLRCIYAEIGWVRQRFMHCLVDPYMVFCTFVCEVIQRLGQRYTCTRFSASFFYQKHAPGSLIPSLDYFLI